jgi:hypothetical protein
VLLKGRAGTSLRAERGQPFSDLGQCLRPGLYRTGLAIFRDWTGKIASLEVHPRRMAALRTGATFRSCGSSARPSRRVTDRR